MPELRKDPIIGRWVIISTERGKRPHDFVVEPEVTKGGFCPFDEGNEHTTPPEVLAVRDPGTEPNTPGWQLRVVNNKFPALATEGELDRAGEGMFDKMNGVGSHEVIIESPDHHLTLATIPVEGFFRVLKAYRDRIMALSEDPRFRYVLIFKNQGRAAGASLEHSHCQLIALPIVPELVQEELSGGKFYYNYKERCVFCDMIRQELQQQTRVVLQNQEFLAICPFAPRSPFEIWILPQAALFVLCGFKGRFFPAAGRALLGNPEAPGESPGPGPVQFHPAHRAHPGITTQLLPLAFRDRPQADPDCRVRVGLGLLYQSYSSGRCGQISSGVDPVILEG